MKIAILYISYFGNTKAIAEKIAKLLNTTDVYGAVFGRFRAFLHMIRLTGGKYPSQDLSNYELIYIGGPVWAGNPAGGFKAFMKKLNLTGKKIVLFSRAGSNNPGTVVQTMERLAAEAGATLVKAFNFNAKCTDEELDKQIKELLA
jgi:flavodoxin